MTGTPQRMWDHVTLRAADLDASATFYDTVLRTLGRERTGTADWIVEWDQFSLSPANAAKPVTRGLHLGFTAPTRQHVHAFWQAGVDAGYRDEGEPGLRPEYGPDYYGGFVLDPDGNSAEAVHHDLVAGRDAIDHLWIRVADVAASKAFYATIAPHTGAVLRTDTPERAQFAGDRGSVSVLAGTPTEELHLDGGERQLRLGRGGFRPRFCSLDAPQTNEVAVPRL